MIEKFKILCRVKQLKEDRLFRELQAKRAELSAAEAEVQKQTDIVTESQRTLPARENAIYQEIMQQIVDVDEIDATKAKVIKLQEDHQALEDRLERAIQKRIRLEKEVAEARLAYQIAQRNRDKYETMKSELEQEQLEIAEYKEESEIEDIFAKGQALPV